MTLIKILINLLLRFLTPKTKIKGPITEDIILEKKIEVESSSADTSLNNELNILCECSFPAKEEFVDVDIPKAIPAIKKTEFRIKNITNQLLRHKALKYKTRNLNQIDKVIIHCSDTPFNSSISGFAKYHVNYLNWPGIGYHFVIDQFGNIHQTNLLTTVSYHVDNNNTSSVGVCLIGQFDRYKPTPMQIDALKWLVNIALKELLNDFSVYGHNTFTKKGKTCPGKYMWDIVKDLQKV